MGRFPKGLLAKLREDYRENLVEVIRRDLDVVLSYARVIAERVEGYWSVDFAKTSRGWYFIDMTLGKASWKPKEKDKLDWLLNS